MSQTRKEPYLHIPLMNLQPVKHLPSGAVLAYMALLHISRVRKQETDIVFSYKQAEQIGLSEQAARRGLKRLEREGLIKVDRGPGKSPKISLF